MMDSGLLPTEPELVLGETRTQVSLEDPKEKESVKEDSSSKKEKKEKKGKKEKVEEDKEEEDDFFDVDVDGEDE